MVLGIYARRGSSSTSEWFSWYSEQIQYCGNVFPLGVTVSLLCRNWLYRVQREKNRLEIQGQSAEKLRQINNQLKKEIAERKKAEEELQKRMEELERFNRLAVGRELQMIELVSRQQKWHRLTPLVRGDFKSIPACRNTLEIVDFGSIIGLLAQKGTERWQNREVLNFLYSERTDVRVVIIKTVLNKLIQKADRIFFSYIFDKTL